MTRVWEESKQEGGALLVLLAMADNADHAGICWPSTPHVARKARLSERQTQRVIDKLISDGEMEIIKKSAGRGKRTVYRVTVKGDTVSSFQKEKGDIGDSKRVTSATGPIIKESSVQSSLKSELAGQLGRIYGIFHKRIDTPMDRAEKTAWKLLTNDGKRLLNEDELAMCERMYKKLWPPNRDKNNLRHSMATFMNNLGGEVDKARAWCEKNVLKGSRRLTCETSRPQAAIKSEPDDPVATDAFLRDFARHHDGRLPFGWSEDNGKFVFSEQSTNGDTPHDET